MATGKFAGAINCMDGRTQQPVRDYMMKEYHVDYVDMITEPGPDGILAEGDTVLIESIRKRVEISVKKHASEVVAVVSHGDCAGNPVSKDEHMRQLAQAAEIVKNWGFGVTVVGLWVDDSDWRVEKVFEK